MKRILITGATSRVGQYLLQNLLEKTDAKLYLLIRKLPHERKIEERFWKIYHDKVTPEVVNDRVRLIPADLARRSLGITDERYNELLDHGIDEVFHLAFFSDRRQFSKDRLFEVNYHGTERLLALASKLRAKVFNHLGLLYAGSWSESHGENYINFLETYSDFYNLNEFVHRMTMQMVSKRVAAYNMHYRIVNPAYLVDADDTPLLENQWYSYVLEPFLRMAQLSKRLELSIPVGNAQNIALTTPRFVADFMTAIHLDGGVSVDQVYNLLTEKRNIRELLFLIPQVLPHINLRFVDKFEDLPWLEKTIFGNSFIFFEYLLQELSLEMNRAALDISERFNLRATPIQNEKFLEITRRALSVSKENLSQLEVGRTRRALIRIAALRRYWKAA